MNPKTLDAIGKAVEIAALEDTLLGAPEQMRNVQYMLSARSGKGLAEAMDKMYPDWSSMDLDEIKKNAEKMDAQGKASIAQLLLGAIQHSSKSSGLWNASKTAWVTIKKWKR